MDSETIAKMRADYDKRKEQVDYEKAADECFQQGQTVGAIRGIGVRAQTSAEVTINQLIERSRYGKSDAEKAEKALDILQRHPEFLEFLELIRTGVVSLY